MELNLARDVKDNTGFYSYICRRRQTKESVPPLTEGNGELASWKKLRYSVSALLQSSWVVRLPMSARTMSL